MILCHPEYHFRLVLHLKFDMQHKGLSFFIDHFFQHIRFALFGVLYIVGQFFRSDGVDVQQVSNQTRQCRFQIFMEYLVILIDLSFFFA